MNGFDIFESYKAAEDYVNSMVKDLEELKKHTAETHPDGHVLRTIEDALERSQEMTVEGGGYDGIYGLGIEIYR